MVPHYRIFGGTFSTASQRSFWVHNFFHIVYLTVYTAGPCCAGVLGIRMLFCCLFGTQHPVIKRSCGGHCSILIILLTVNKAGPCCVVMVVSRCFPTASSRTPSKWLPTRDCFGSLCYLYHPLLSGLQALAEMV
jgi:hypothetical protein